MSKKYIEVLDIEEPVPEKIPDNIPDVTDELFEGTFRLQQAYCCKRQCKDCKGLTLCAQYLNGSPQDWNLKQHQTKGGPGTT